MSDSKSSTALLEGAYAIQTPEDSVTYYRDFAAKYDADFVAALGYEMPALLAKTFAAFASEKDRPVADIGCGTGAVAQNLALDPSQIDGFDISKDMLAVARSKNLYRNLVRVDLTQSQPVPHQPYGAVVSAGTFTHGHLGPAPLANLLSLARPGALFCIGINAAHFEKEQFGPALDALQSGGEISAYQLRAVPLYSKSDHDHGRDKGQILTFRKT